MTFFIYTSILNLRLVLNIFLFSVGTVQLRGKLWKNKNKTKQAKQRTIYCSNKKYYWRYVAPCAFRLDEVDSQHQ
jgi:hypothetical protein